MKTSEDNISILDLATQNKELHEKIEVILQNLETQGITELEDQVSALLKNMMNFFAKYVSEIPAFDSLTPGQQKTLLLRFNSVADNLSGRKIKSIEELLQVFLFTILSGIGQTIEEAKEYTKEELLAKKQRDELRKLLRRAAAYEIYKITNPRELAGETKEQNFINNAIFLGVKEALKFAGLELSDLNKIDRKTIQTLELAHQSFQKSIQRSRSR